MWGKLNARFWPKSTHFLVKSAHFLKGFDKYSRFVLICLLSHQIVMPGWPSFLRLFFHQTLYMYTNFYFVRFIIFFLLLSPAIGNVVNGQVVADSSCGVIYQCTSINPVRGGDATYPFNQIRTMNPDNGIGGGTIFNGLAGPCYNAITGAALPARSVLKNASAIAYDVNTNRIYFVNNTTTNSPAEDLCYIDLNTSPVSAKKFVNYPL